MFGRVRRVLVRPGTAVADRPTALAGPLALVFVLGVVAVGGTLVPGLVLLDTHVPSLLPESPDVSIATSTGSVAVPALTLQIMVASLLAPFGFWLVTAALVHGLTALVAFGGAARDGRVDFAAGYPSRTALATRFDAFRRTLVAVGWGYAPQILASLVTAAVFVPFYLFGPDLLPRAMQLTPAGHTVVEIPELPALTMVTHSVGAASVLWTGYVWVGGLQATRDVSRRTAVAAVLPVATVLILVSDLVALLA